MKTTALPVHTGFKKLLIVQLAIIATVAMVYFFTQGMSAGEAAIYGGAMALSNLWISERRLRMMAAAGKIAPEKEAMLLYAGAIQRVVFTLLFFWAGMSWLKLDPIPLIVAFSLAQVAYLFKGNAK